MVYGHSVVHNADWRQPISHWVRRKRSASIPFHCIAFMHRSFFTALLRCLQWIVRLSNFEINCLTICCILEIKTICIQESVLANIINKGLD